MNDVDYVNLQNKSEMSLFPGHCREPVPHWLWAHPGQHKAFFGHEQRACTVCPYPWLPICHGRSQRTQQPLDPGIQGVKTSLFNLWNYSFLPDLCFIYHLTTIWFSQIKNCICIYPYLTLFRILAPEHTCPYAHTLSCSSLFSPLCSWLESQSLAPQKICAICGKHCRRNRVKRKLKNTSFNKLPNVRRWVGLYRPTGGSTCLLASSRLFYRVAWFYIYFEFTWPLPVILYMN